MSRISYTDEEDFPGQTALWDANCQRSIQGKQGQKELRELREAISALPHKRLIYGSLVDEDGDVCAVGAYAYHKGLDLGMFDPEDETDEVGIQAGMPGPVAWKVVAINDIIFKSLTPEDRYTKMIEWVDRQLSGAATT